MAKDKEAYSSRGNYNFAVSNGHLQFGFQPQPSGEDVWIDTAARVLDSHEWTFVAVTFTFAGNEKPRIYANGLVAPLGEWQGSGDHADLPFTYSDPLYIGKSSSDGLFFDGIIDEVKIYNRVLTQEEIAAEGS